MCLYLEMSKNRHFFYLKPVIFRFVQKPSTHYFIPKFLNYILIQISYEYFYTLLYKILLYIFAQLHNPNLPQ